MKKTIIWLIFTITFFLLFIELLFIWSQATTTVYATECKEETFGYCDASGCPGFNLPPMHVARVTRHCSADGTAWYSCEDAGLQPGQCGYNPSPSPSPSPKTSPAAGSTSSPTPTGGGTNNTRLYIDSPLAPGQQTEVIATGTRGCSTYIDLQPGGGLTCGDRTITTCGGGNPKDSNPCWWKWPCTAGTVGSYIGTFNASGTNCSSSASYTISSGTISSGSIGSGMSTPTTTVSPTPTPSTRTTHYRFSTTRFDKNDQTPEWQAYTVEPIIKDLSFPTTAQIGDSITVFAQFKEQGGTTSEVYSKTIKLGAGEPRLTSISCSYDPSGIGTVATIKGENFGEQDGASAKINSLPADLISWQTGAPIIPTPASTSASTQCSGVGEPCGIGISGESLGECCQGLVCDESRLPDAGGICKSTSGKLAQCNQTCYSAGNLCDVGLWCVQLNPNLLGSGKCRNPNCIDDTDCNCDGSILTASPSATPTSTPSVIPTGTTTWLNWPNWLEIKPASAQTTRTCDDADQRAISIEVPQNNVPAGSQITFKINGDASTFIVDTYGGGVTTACEDALGWQWSEGRATRTCTTTNPGTYTWTHKWKPCRGLDSDGNYIGCSPVYCEKTASFTVLSSSVTPLATPTPGPGSPTPIPPAGPCTGNSCVKIPYTVTARINERIPSGTRVPVSLTTAAGITLNGSCTINTTTVDFTSKMQCRSVPNMSEDNVLVKIVEKTEKANPVVNKKIKFDADGKPVDLAAVLEVGKTYYLSIKAPKTLSRKVEFTAQPGTTILDDIVLPIGDIYPTASSDGKINTFDKAELTRQWMLTTDVTRTGDLNKDLRVNSVDYSCLRENIGKSDE